MSSGYYRRSDFLGLCDPTCVLFSMVAVLQVFFNSHKCTPISHTLHLTELVTCYATLNKLCFCHRKVGDMNTFQAHPLRFHV